MFKNIHQNKEHILTAWFVLKSLWLFIVTKYAMFARFTRYFVLIIKMAIYSPRRWQQNHSRRRECAIKCKKLTTMHIFLDKYQQQFHALLFYMREESHTSADFDYVMKKMATSIYTRCLCMLESKRSWVLNLVGNI